MIRFTLNGNNYEFPGADDTPLLWVLRDSAGLTGTKYGCGTGQCGACTVHVDGGARRACVTIGQRRVTGRTVTTIEGSITRRVTSGTEGVARDQRRTMRVLPERPDHVSGGDARAPALAE